MKQKTKRNLIKLSFFLFFPIRMEATFLIFISCKYINNRIFPFRKLLTFSVWKILISTWSPSRLINDVPTFQGMRSRRDTFPTTEEIWLRLGEVTRALSGLTEIKHWRTTITDVRRVRIARGFAHGAARAHIIFHVCRSIPITSTIPRFE